MDIAIIGMAGTFPEADDFLAFHQNLKNGRDSVRPLSERRLLSTAIPRKNYQIEGFIEEIEFFDSQFFDISVGEAQKTDPHQRLLLQTVYQAIENTGNAGKLVGSNTDLYVSLPSFGYTGLFDQEEVDITAYVGNSARLTPGRIARYFNLLGSAALIDTTCSSSLYAVHLACNAIRSGEADQAVVCAARLMLVPPLRANGGIGIEAPDGKTKAFSWQANGTGGGEAVAAVVLKPLSRALQDNDNIHAVIKATAANQDGQRSSYLTAPSKVAQAEVIKASWRKAGIPVESIGFIQAHGTGTQVGDPIEIDGLDLAFKAFTSRRHFVPIASLKSNIGHTDACAGLCSLIAAVLSVKYGQIYPSLHYDKPNPLIAFDEKAVFVNAELRDWPAGAGQRRAGVSSFGLSGTNVHVVVEGLAKTAAPGDPAAGGWYIFTASGKTAQALHNNLERMSRFLRECDPALMPPLPDLSYTSTQGRPHYKHRAAVVYRDALHLAALLEDRLNSPGEPRQRQGPAVLLLAGGLPACDLRDVFAVSAASLRLYEAVVAAVGRPLTPPWRQFIFQYVLAKFLSDVGLPAGSVAGVGTGAVVASALADNVPLAEAIRRMEDYVGGGAAEPGPEATRAAAAQYDGRFVLANFPQEEPGEPVGFDGHRIGKGPDLLLACLAALYTGGHDIQWAAFHQGGPGSVADLPGYQFEKKRCWIREPLDKHVNEWLYTLEWTPLEEAPARGPAEPGKRFLLFGAEAAGLGPGFVAQCADHNVSLVRVSHDKTFRKVDEDAFTLDYRNELHLKMLAQQLRQPIDGVMDLSSCAYPGSQPGSFREEVLASLALKLHVVKAFEPLLADRAFAVVYVTNQGQNVGPGGVDFANCLAGTFLKSLLSDYPAIQAKLIDVDLHQPVPLGQVLLAELFSASHLRFVAYRNQQRYVQQLVPLKGAAQESFGPVVPPGTFLLTGGATGVGLVIAKDLARRYPGCRLIILGRTQVEGQPAATPATRAARGVAQLRAMGASVRYYPVDIADEEQLKKTFGQIGQEHDRIDEVYHAAGIAGKWHPTRLKKLSDFDGVFGPKVYGSLYLDQCVQPFRPRLFVCISSINALVPQKESAEYALANAFEDAFAWNRSSAACRYVSINWPGWLLEDKASPTGQEFNELRNISPEDGVAALGYCLRAGRPNVIVADVDLQHFRVNPFFAIGDAPLVLAGEDTPPPAKAQPGQQPDVLAGVMALFEKILKPEAFTEDSDFFDLGGNSLIGAQLINALHDGYGVQLGFDDLLDMATPAQLAGHILLTRSLAEKQVAAPEFAPIEEQEYYRPLLEQQGWWIRSKYWTEPFAFHMSRIYELSEYDEATFGQTFRVLLRRHEALRSTFFLREGSIRVRVHEPEALVLNHQFADCSADPDPEARTAQLFHQESMKPFALDQVPLLKTLTVKQNENRYYTLLVIHHIISDAITVEVVEREFLDIYRSLKDNEEPRLTPLSIQYKDFVAWRALKMNLLRDEFLQLWRTTVVPAVTGPQYPASFSDLPPAQPAGFREALQADLRQYFHPWVMGNVNDVPALAGITKPLVGASYVAFIDTPLLNEMRLFSRQERVTPFILTTAVLAMLHHQLTGRCHLVFGTPVSLRNDKSCEGLTGWFLSTNLMYIHTQPDLPFLDWLKQTGDVLWDFLKYRMYPFEKLLEDLDLSPAYVDAVFLNYINTEGFGQETTAFAGAGHRGHGTPTFDINFTFTEYANGVKLVCDYRPALFTPGAIEQIVAQYLELLRAVLLNPKEQLAAYIHKPIPVPVA